MRRLGAMPYMTPLQRATESSRTPKSVMKTTVGGGCTADCCAATGLATRNKTAAATHNKTRGRQNVRADFPTLVDFIRIESNSPKRLLVYSGLESAIARTRRKSHRESLGWCRLFGGAYDCTRSRAGTQSSVKQTAVRDLATEKRMRCAIVALPASIIGAAINQSAKNQWRREHRCPTRFPKNMSTFSTSARSPVLAPSCTTDGRR